MADIAARVGILRTNLYRYVQSKHELLNQVLIQRVRAVHAERRPAVPFNGAAGPIIVAALLDEHTLARDDELLQLARSAEIAPHTAALIRTDDALLAATCQFWEPLLQYGRTRGELRPDLTNREIIRWFFLVQYMLIMNRSIFRGDDEIELYLRRMVGAAVLADPTSV